MNHLRYALCVLSSLFMFACASAPAAPEQVSVESSPQAKPRVASPDPLQVAEAWFAAALEDRALLPEGEDTLGPEVSAYRLVRIFQQSPRHYFAIFALDGEPSRTPALQIELMVDDQGTWYVVDALWAAPRGLWPRV